MMENREIKRVDQIEPGEQFAFSGCNNINRSIIMKKQQFVICMHMEPDETVYKKADNQGYTSNLNDAYFYDDLKYCIRQVNKIDYPHITIAVIIMKQVYLK